MKSLVAFFLFFFVLGCKAEVIAFSDDPWTKEELEKIALSNLILNGDFKIPPATTYDDRFPGHTQVAQCWSSPDDQVAKLRTNDGRLPKISEVNLGEHNNFKLIGIPIFYPLSREHDDIVIRVEGVFKSPNAEVVIFKCNIQCVEERQVLTGDDLKIEARFKDLKGFYLSKIIFHFYNGVSFVHKIHAGSIANQFKDDRVSERDFKAVQICGKTKASLDDSKIWHVIVMALLTALLLMVIAMQLIKGEIFLTLLLIVYATTSFFGCWGLYFGLSDYRLSQGVDRRELIVILAAVNFLTVFLTCVGWGIAERLLSSSFKQLSAKIFSRLRPNWIWILYMALIFPAVWMSAPYAYAYIIANMGCTTEACGVALSSIRQATTLEWLPFKSHYIKLILFHFTSLLSFVVIAKLITSYSRFRNILVLGIIFLQMCVFLYNGEKASIIWYIFSLSYLLLQHADYRWKELKISRSWLFLLGIFLGTLAAASFGYSLADRLIYASLTVGNKILDIFPNQLHFLQGATIINPGRIMDRDVFDLPFFLWRSLHPEIFFSSLSGTAATAFWGDAYANFGYSGIAVASFVMGFMLYSASKIFTFSRYNFFALGCAAWMIFHYSSFTEAHFFSFLFDFYGLSVIAFISLIGVLDIFLDKFFRKR